jgi:hypothetical protein
VSVAHKEKHTPNNPDVIAHRRELVARLRIRGLSLREIVVALAKPGEGQIINPQSDEPFTLTTIKEDCHYLDKEWLKRQAATTDSHKARVYLEIQEVKRAAWKDNDLSVLLRALKQECDLLGLDAPKQVDITLIRQKAQEIADRLGVPVGDVVAQAARVAGDVLQGVEL